MRNTFGKKGNKIIETFEINSANDQTLKIILQMEE